MEKVYEDEGVTFAFADVLFVSKMNSEYSKSIGQIEIVFKGSTYNEDQGAYNNAVYLNNNHNYANVFMTKWKQYIKDIK